MKMYIEKSKKELREERTKNLKNDYSVYLKVRLYRENKPMTWEQWVGWVHKMKSADRNSVFFGMTLEEYVNI